MLSIHNSGGSTCTLNSVSIICISRLPITHNQSYDGFDRLYRVFALLEQLVEHIWEAGQASFWVVCMPCR
jgi:hypothetical protein